MFCKWCGGNLASSDTKCKRCGKEVPALSNCGGFYDLVPNAKKPGDIQPSPVVPPAKPATPPRKPEPTREAEPARTKKSNKKSFLGLLIINVVGFALVILMLLLIGSKVNQYSTEVNSLQTELETISEKIDSLAVSTEPVVDEPDVTEPTAVPDPVLAEQNVKFTVGINGKESAQEVVEELDLGDYKDTAKISYGMDEELNAINSIRYTLKEAGAAVVLTMECSNEFRTKNLSVSYVIDEIAYGPVDAPETCKWQYRFGSDADWEDIPDTFVQTNDAGKAGLSVKEAVLADLAADSEGEFELRCEISRTNTEGGSLTMVIEGIRLYEETNSNEQTVN